MALHLGVSQMGAGSKTSVGGYDEHNKDKEGTTLIKEELNKLPSQKVREIVEEKLVKIEEGERDFRF
jgi:hypothetical protein